MYSFDDLGEHFRWAYSFVPPWFKQLVVKEGAGMVFRSVLRRPKKEEFPAQAPLPAVQPPPLPKVGKPKRKREKKRRGRKR